MTSWKFAARRAVHGFMRHRGLDSAAALSFFSALAIFPAALTVVAAFALGNAQRATEVILAIADEVLQPETIDTIRAPLDALVTIGNPAIALAIGIALSLWSVASYATAFGRAVNGAYEVQEGRQLWKFRGTMLLLSAFLLLVSAAIVALLVTTPRIASAIGQTLGVGEPWVTVFNFARWPVLVFLVTLVVAVLYYATPNVKHQHLRWVSHGAIFAIVAWSIATAVFALYVFTVAPYDRVYGWLGGGIVLLLWLYLTNLVLVFGAEVDVEVMRLRQLHAGIAAEEVVQIPVRDFARNHLLARQRSDDEAEGRRIREDATAVLQETATEVHRESD